MPPSSLTNSRLNRLYWVAAFMLLLTQAVLVWQARSAAIEPAANDDAEYVLLARSLRGFHYQDQHILGSPTHAQYPPVYPGLLAVGTAVFGDHLGVVQVTTLLCSVLALLLIFDMARRLASPLVGLLLLAPLAFNAHLVGYAGRIASEVPFMAFSFATLWVLVAFPQSRRPLLWAGVFAILAALTRSIGISIVIAMLAFLLLQRRFKPALLFAGAAALTVGAWLYWTTVSPDQFTDRSYTAVAATKTVKDAPKGALGTLVVRTNKFVKTYVFRSFAAGLEFPTRAGTSIDNAVLVLLILGLGGAGLWSVRKRLPLLPLYLLSFLGLLLVYPFKLTRFFMPVAPLFLLAMYLGAIALTRRKPGIGVAVMVLLSGAILTSSVPGSLALVKKLEGCDRSAALTSRPCWRPASYAFLTATQRAREILPKNAVVLTIKEAAFNYYTGLTVYHPVLAREKGRRDVLRFLKENGIDYVLFNGFAGGRDSKSYVAPICQRVEVLARFEPVTALFQIHPSRDSLPVARNACRLIEEWTSYPDLDQGEDAEE